MTHTQMRGLVVMLVAIAAVVPAGAADRPPASGEAMPGILLPVPEDPGQKKYLGVTSCSPQ